MQTIGLSASALTIFMAFGGLIWASNDDCVPLLDSGRGGVNEHLAATCPPGRPKGEKTNHFASDSPVDSARGASALCRYRDIFALC
jgi:hypothetical protein